jgi:hypothetical protein
MELDNDDDLGFANGSRSKTAIAGEAIASSTEYMRYALWYGVIDVC